ncbi:WNT1-inducible-signaling pathway protein 1 [Triplophysa tibetana]|uniref:WNT1-inducible-signaling pathway protein 1 n=1 Tax=Triplophysa tibetana TaxID=1572043 RepID=A0A5A9NQH5_9TELE|nr:WNT1-inducible-signaling pathway protein 1 [Triplophysa tibetana]
MLYLTESHNRTQYCQWPCKCPKTPSTCQPGVSLIMDGCECCRACAKQLGEICNEKDNCDHHRGLYCDYSSDKPRLWCQNPQRVKISGRCCEQWICDDSVRGRKTAPQQTIAGLSGGNDDSNKNCVTQTTSWSPCSKTCDRGVSARITNKNKQCQMVKESRLCKIRPCEVDFTKHIRPGKKCLNIFMEKRPHNFTISGCTSTKSYQPKYCGVCTDERCCIPYKSKTVEVEFQCPNGSSFTWHIMWINACFCNLSCRNPNDIFTDLEQYYETREIGN